MLSFLSVPTLPRGTPRRRATTRLSAQREPNQPPISLDTLHTFTSFCTHAQEALCAQTAELDGLGTFAPTPQAYPPTAQQTGHRDMHGGRFFSSAQISVWTSTTSRAGHPREAAGLSVKLSPRDPALPALRADAHYFQIGAAGRVAWWFAGTADLSAGPAALPNAFEGHVNPFLQTWEGLQERHRRTTADARKAFLDACLGEDPDLAKGGGFDRGRAFAFITEVVDGLLPAYLPLLAGANPSGLAGLGQDVWRGSGFGMKGGFGEEEVDQFCIEGGASCESTIVRASPLGSWRFSIAPSGHTPAGKAYANLRNDHRCGTVPFLYI